MCSVRSRVSFRSPVLACLCLLSAGCVTTTETRTVGSFASGGPGQYGESAPGGGKPTAKTPDSDYKPSSFLQLKAAELQEKRGYSDEARKSYEQVLAADANSADAVIGLARLDQVAGRTAQAEAGFQKAIRMDSNSARSLDALGQFYVQQKRWNDALAILQRAMTAAPENKEYRFHYAVALAKSGQIHVSKTMLTELVGSAATHYNIGLVLHERGELAGAEDEFIAAILENPRMQQAQYWLNEVRRERDQAQFGKGNGAAVGMQPAVQTIVPTSATMPQGPQRAHFAEPATQGFGNSWPAAQAGASNYIEAPPPRATAGSSGGNAPGAAGGSRTSVVQAGGTAAVPSWDGSNSQR